MGNDSIIAFRTREQLRKYLGIFSPQFRNSRWKMEFLGQMLFGIQASRDTLMSEIARSLQEEILAKKTQERLERHLATDGMDAKKHCRLCVLPGVSGVQANWSVNVPVAIVCDRLQLETVTGWQLSETDQPLSPHENTEEAAHVPLAPLPVRSAHSVAVLLCTSS